MTTIVVVLLDDVNFPADGGKVIAKVATAKKYREFASDRDGAISEKIRFWEGDFPIGTRVKMGQFEDPAKE